MAAGEWDEVELGEVAEHVKRTVTLTDDDEYLRLTIRLRGQGIGVRDRVPGTRIKTKKQFLVRPDDLVVAEIDAKVGGFGIAPTECEGAIVSNHYFVFELDRERVLPEWVDLLCRANHFTVQVEAQGSTNYAAVRPAQVLVYTLPLPSLDEQQQIVAVVAALDDTIASYEEERSAARSLLAAAREHMVRDCEPRRLGDLVSGIEAGKSPKAFDRPPRDGERAVLKVSAIRPGDFRGAESKAVPEDVVFPGHALVRRGDVLIGRANTRELVGSVCLVEGVADNLYLSDKTLRLIPKNDLVDRTFLAHVAASSAVRQQIEDAATGTSESMRNISQKVILDLDVPVPESIGEQQRIAERLDTLAGAVRRANALLVHARSLRSSIIDSLLRRASDPRL